jgi:hypothetical protein
MVDFDATPSEEVLQTIDTLRAGDLVVLIQTDAFNLREYRFRLELFKRGLKVRHHTQLPCTSRLRAALLGVKVWSDRRLGLAEHRARPLGAHSR